ncbi:hypothetical protein RclHR1_00180011 [Rhizophagus clarus]|uniref:Uncharacterized protein n=1 Tax=Rhizophagus clarus TaxID=94130 RepID=A0A2Z6QL14_9GLOM|nr:hypothetical protein RclHR1_00180011 [Rhizophagus clarus]
MFEISENPFFTRVDKAVSSYFKDKPAGLWSYDSFLEKLNSLIMEDEVDQTVWRKRFLTALKEIINDYTNDEQVRNIASLLSNQKNIGIINPAKSSEQKDDKLSNSPLAKLLSQTKSRTQDEDHILFLFLFLSGVQTIRTETILSTNNNMNENI